MRSAIPWNGRGTAAPAPNALDQVMSGLGIVVLVSMPFIVGDQPKGAEALNPVNMLETVSTGGDVVKQVILLGMYALFGVCLLMRERPRRLLFLGTPLLLLVCWTFASTFWSVQPDVTLRRAVALAGSISFGVFLGLRLDLSRMITVLSWACLVILAASLLLAVINPSLGLDFEGRLRGVTAHKNAIGNFAALAFLTALSGLGVRRAERLAVLRHAALAVLALVCMGLARSTAVLPILLAAIAALGLGAFWRRASNRELAFFPLAICIGLILVMVAARHSSEIAEFLGKDPDISGRTLVWNFAEHMIQAQPLAGYGYGAFWVGGNSPGAVFWANTHLGVPHAHNGYLQLLLEAGFTALALDLIGVALLGARLLKLVRAEPGEMSLWPLGFLAFYLVANLSETLLWVGNELVPILFVSTIVQTNVFNLTYSRRSTGRAYALYDTAVHSSRSY